MSLWCDLPVIYEKNRTNELGAWLMVALAVVAGPALYLKEPGAVGKLVGMVLTGGGVALVFILLFSSVRKVTTHDDRVEIAYYLRKEIVPYSLIKDVKLRRERHSSKGITRELDVIDLYVYPDRKIRLGGYFGGFFRHTTKKLYNELTVLVGI